MKESELLAETNELLRRIVQIDDEQRHAAERSKAEIEQQMAEMKVVREKTTKQTLEAQGLSGEGIEGTPKDWEDRMKEAQRKSEENQRVMREKDEYYKNQLLKELSEQTRLLALIAEKLQQ